MKILFLPKYDYSGPSSRYRTYRYLDLYKQNGIKFDVFPFFDNKHIANINNNKSKFGFNIIKNIINRIYVLTKSRKYDFLFIEKELIPYFPPILETILSFFKIKYILDFDDAVFHNYDNSKRIMTRIFLGNKIPSIIAKANHIICGSQYLSEFALKYNSNVTYIPTSVDISNYDPPIRKKSTFVIGWIGSSSTSINIISILDQLDFICNKYSCKINLVGFDKKLIDRHSQLKKKHYKIIDWNENKEVELIRNFSVGISPTEDTPFNRGKCAFKSIQYMACGIPVITSPVGANSTVVDHNSTGFHAVNKTDWIYYLEKIINNPYLLEEFGQNGYKKVQNQYTIQVNLKKYLKIYNKM